MNIKLALIAALAVGVTSLLIGGCATDPTEEPGQNQDVASSEDEVRAGLAGGFHFVSGGAPKFKGITFLKNGTFFTDVSDGERVAGRFTAANNVLTLIRPPTADDSVHYGEYRYTFTGQKLTITKPGGAAGWSNVLVKKLSYCDNSDVDCSGQEYINGLVHGACTGDWKCGATHTCAWVCE